MNVRRPNSLLIAVALALSGIGCPGSRQTSSNSGGSPAGDCLSDADCAKTEVCDSDGQCLAQVDADRFGVECDESYLPTDDPILGSKLRGCAAYICQASRCRSCVSNDQCQELLGAPVCGVEPGRPGRRCGAPPAQ